MFHYIYLPDNIIRISHPMQDTSSRQLDLTPYNTTKNLANPQGYAWSRLSFSIRVTRILWFGFRNN